MKTQQDELGFKLYIVGTGNPDPYQERFGSCFVLEAGVERIMIDCGPATTYKLVKTGIRAVDIDHLFFTHHHSDHNADYPCFALTRWDQSINSTPVLNVYGPAPTAEFHRRLFGEDGAFAPDLSARINHPISQGLFVKRGGVLPRPPLRSNVLDLDSEESIRTSRWQVTTREVRHIGPYLTNLAYRFDFGEKIIVFAGDCANCDELIEISRGADILVMACTFFERDSKYRACVPGTHDVIDVVKKAGVGTVIITHMNAQFTKPGIKEKAVAQIARGCDASIIAPDEVECVDLGFDYSASRDGD